MAKEATLGLGLAGRRLSAVLGKLVDPRVVQPTSSSTPQLLLHLVMKMWLHTLIQQLGEPRHHRPPKLVKYRRHVLALQVCVVWPHHVRVDHLPAESRLPWHVTELKRLDYRE
jgi:hypothetical protein